MQFTSKKKSLLLLGITALFCSRTLFFLFDDPEGPNLLIVVVMAATIFSVSLPAYLIGIANFKKLPLAIFTQIAVTAVLYFLLTYVF